MKKLIPFLMIFSIACSKSDTNNSTPKDILLSGKWVVQSIVYNPPIDFMDNGIKASDVFPEYEDCEMDNFFLFTLPGQLAYDEGPTKCDPTGPQAQPGTWTLTNNDSEVIIDDGWVQLNFKIFPDKLIGDYTMPDFDSTNGGKDYIITTTLLLQK